jgi:hypothetical protein
MAYPFGPWPTWSEIIHRLNALGVSYQDEKVLVGKKHFRIQYFEHKMDGKTIRCEISFSDPSERLVPGMIRYICNRLQINPSFFGLNLG